MLDLIQVAAGCTDANLKTIIEFIQSIFNLLCIIIPIGLIIFGAIDLGKAVIASDEKEIKGATNKVIKRAISAVIVFILPTLVKLIFGLLPDGAVSFVDCWTSFILR